MVAVTLGKVVLTAAVIWLVARVSGGVELAAGLDPLEVVGTLLVVALLLAVLDAAAAPVRRAVRRLAATLPVALATAVVLNAAVFWLAGWCARAIGLGFAVTGFVPALVGSLLLATLIRLVPAGGS